MALFPKMPIRGKLYLLFFLSSKGISLLSNCVRDTLSKTIIIQGQDQDNPFHTKLFPEISKH